MRLLLGLLTVVLALSLVYEASAQPVHGSATRSAPEGEAQARLPLSKVVLYSSGVGYFQHDGQVFGRTPIELRFKVDAINDLLKSLVVQDLSGGHVSIVTYDSRDPIAKTLQSFGVN